MKQNACTIQKAKVYVINFIFGSRIEYSTHYARYKCGNLNILMFNNLLMSAELKFAKHIRPEATLKGRVKLTDLLDRLNKEKKKERNSNIAMSVAAVSAVTVFGIILSL